MVALPDEIDAKYCVVETVKALQDAKKLAIQQNDTKTMMDVIAGWFELHDRFVAGEEDDARASRGFGFQSTRDEEEDLEVISHETYEPFEQEDEYDTDEPAEDRS